MESINAKFRGRIIQLMIAWLLLGCLVGFACGWFVGYRNGRADTLEEIEQKLSQPKQETTPTLTPT